MKIIFVNVLYCLCSLGLLAQNYFPFPDSNATWNVVDCSLDDSRPWLTCGFKTYHEFKIEGDTLINNMKYGKIYNYTEYIGAIREDSMKSIYFYGNLITATWTDNSVKDTVKEYLLYQFGLDVGDSISAFKLKPSASPRYILSIDSIKIDGEYRLRYHVSNPYLLQNDYWIEGIGSEAGLFAPYSREFENEWRLYCFKQNGKFIWPDTTGDCLTVSVEDIEIGKKIKVYPNPVSSTWHIQSEKNAVLEIYSLSGKEILRKEIQIGTEQINVSQFLEGIYFYRISSENEELMKSGKLVKH